MTHIRKLKPVTPGQRDLASKKTVAHKHAAVQSTEADLASKKTVAHKHATVQSTKIYEAKAPDSRNIE